MATTTRDGLELLIAAKTELDHCCLDCRARCEVLRAELGAYLARLGDLRAYVESRLAAREANAIDSAIDAAAGKRERVAADMAKPVPRPAPTSMPGGCGMSPAEELGAIGRRR